jgi:two-component system response regulator FixJ
MTHDPRPDVAVVDDDVAVLDSFKFMLEMAGFVVATYPSAIAYLQHQGMDPRCLILDQHMPEMTGLELTTRLRADGVTIPVLLVTSASSPAIVASATRMGIIRVLDKPPNAEELISFVNGCERPADRPPP